MTATAVGVGVSALGGLMSFGAKNQAAEAYRQQARQIEATVTATQPYYEEAAALELKKWGQEELKYREQAYWNEYNASMVTTMAGHNVLTAEAQAAAVRDKYVAAAQQIRREGERVQSEQVVRYLKGGVRLEGTPVLVMLHTQAMAEEDSSRTSEAGEVEATQILNQAALKKIEAETAALEFGLQARQARRAAEMVKEIAPREAHKILMEGWNMYAGAQTSAYAARSKAYESSLSGAGSLLTTGLNIYEKYKK